MSKAKSESLSSEPGGRATWIARDQKSGRFVEVPASHRTSSTIVREQDPSRSDFKRRAGRFKGILEVGPEFFEPLTEVDLEAFRGK